MPDLPTASVVVPTHGRADLLPTVLAPLLRDPATAEVVAVADGDDDAYAVLGTLAGRDPRLVPLRTDGAGENAARQSGIDRARGDIVVLLDDDVLARDGLVTGHARAHVARRDVVVLGYMPVAEPLCDGPPTQLYAGWYEEAVERYEREPGSILHSFWAGNASLRRADALRVGLADASFTATYNPDRDFGLRCARAGLTGVFDRRLRADHLYRRSLRQMRAEARRQGEGRVLVHHRHPDLVGPLHRDTFADGLPPARAALVRAARRPHARRAVSAAAAAVARAPLPARARRAAALVDVRVGQQEAATEVARRLRATGPLPVSVVIPAYERAEMTRRAVRSALAQTRPPAEVLVVDDCSSDDTGAVAAEAGARVIRHDVNRGEGGARNTGLREAAQPWVALLDSDDEWLPHHLETIWPLRAGRVLAAGTCVGVGEDGTPRKPYGVPGPRPRVLRSPAAVAFPENCVPPSAALLHRETALAAGGFDTALERCADLDLWVRMLERGRGVVSPEITAVYHLHEGQVSADGMAMQAAHAAVLDAYDGRPWCTHALRTRFAGLRDWDQARARQAAGDRFGALNALGPALRDPRRAAGIPPALMLRRRVRRRTAALAAEGVAR
jgi:glycosyltransferase involved in cell wall biosynthesis